MRCTGRIAVSAFLVLGLIAGCGRSDRGGQAASDASSSQANGATAKDAAAVESGGPAEAVARFLEAVRTGNDEVATKMFTPLARQKASELGIQVAPRGSDTARFEVGKVDMIAADGARVASKWADLDKSGQTRTDDITWMVRHETEGWRVAGMAAVVFEGEPPLLLDFEKPEETMKRLDMLREEVQRRMAKDDPPGRRGEVAGQVRQSEQAVAGAFQGPHPLRPAVKDDQQLQQVSQTRDVPAQQADQALPAAPDQRVQEAQRSRNPSDPFQR